LLLVGGGCARTVTQLVTYGEQMVVEVTLRGNFDINSNRYFLVLSDRSDYNVPLPPPDFREEAPEFLEPGMTPTTGSPEAYQNIFYSTWSGYIVIDTSGYSLVKGPFVLGQVPTREAIKNIGEAGDRLSFSFRLGQMFGSVPDPIYFDFVAVPWPDGSEKIPADHLPTTNNYISSLEGSVITVEDDPESLLDASLDIDNCRVEIQ
jgi:hypothetical protein